MVATSKTTFYLKKSKTHLKILHKKKTRQTCENFDFTLYEEVAAHLPPLSVQTYATPIA